MIEQKMDELKKKLIEEASLAERMVSDSIKGLLDKDDKALDEVVSELEPRMNDLEIEIDELCTNFIALYEPRAGALRTVLMILKMNNDLERIGDLAVNISTSSKYLIQHPQVKPLIDIPKMADEATKMLRDSIDAFINSNTQLAHEVCERDEIVDNLRDQILRELITYMTADPSTIERSIHLIKISRNLERVADLSTNIAEDVIFMVEGRIIKHHKDEKQA